MSWLLSLDNQLQQNDFLKSISNCKHGKNPTLGSGTYLNSLYKGVPAWGFVIDEIFATMPQKPYYAWKHLWSLHWGKMGLIPNLSTEKLKIWVYNVEDVITRMGDREGLRSIRETPE